MIKFNTNSPLNENKSSINITYPRNVDIIFGNYSYPDVINNFIIQIKNNLNPDLKNFTNVKGEMTSWDFFTKKPEFVNFITYLINKYQTSHPDIFQYFLERKDIQNAWGNQIKKGDRLSFHKHPSFHGILYLTEGCDLILPELNLQISPKPGDYYIFPPEILHGFDVYQEDNIRYSLIFNIVQRFNSFDFDNKLTTV
tara:strand:- start:1651 stop:2241 length:591 start_codon:yes stop_codon:yes gene_type:complete